MIMKKSYIILAVLALGALASCKKEATPAMRPVVLVKEIAMTFGDDVAAKVYVDENGDAVFPLQAGKNVTVGCKFTPDEGELTSKQIRWSSSNEEVATVNEGLITGVNEGEAGITVQQYPFSVTAQATLKVKVFKTAVPATGVSIVVPADRELHTDDTPIVYEGETIDLDALVTPKEATYKTVTWSVDKSDIATIDPISGELTGVKEGQATVTATCVEEKGVKASVTFTIAPSIAPSSIHFLSEGGLLSVADATYEIEYETVPALCNRSVIIWQSSDEEVATVEKGVVTLHKYGKVEISATCPDSDDPNASASLTLDIPAGYYHEHLENPALWIPKTTGMTMTLKISDAGETYYDIVPNKANANTGRGDFGRVAPTFISRAYPIITLRMDDVNDKADETGVEGKKFSRNINLDTSGNAEDGTKFSGNLGGNNNKWLRKIPCSDGSVILVYDLSSQAFANGGVLPENVPVNFSTWQIKYADIRNSGKEDIKDINNLGYRFFWFHTFTSNEEMNAYLAAWTARTGITYEGGPGWEEPEPPAVPAGLKLDKASDKASITDGTYTIGYTTSPATGDDVPSITWTSSNPEVATVADGVVTILSVGSVQITATCVGDKDAPEGFVRSANFTLDIPVGFYQEHMTNTDLWAKGQNGTVITQLTSEAGEKYLNVVPENQTNKGRGDIKHVGDVSLNRAYPIVTFRIDDVNDRADETGTEGKKFSRNINMDTNGTGSDEATYKGNFGGNNNKWSRKIKCSDGSSILVYNLATQSFPTGGILPEDVTANLTTFQIKYADIKNSDSSNIQDINHMAYRYFWFHTFQSEDELNAYLTSWSSKTGITYE